MQAIQVQRHDSGTSLTIGETPTPEPAPDELLVRIKATALNRADLHQRAGNYPPPEGASDILGLEMAGMVEKTGDEVEGWEIGDRVFALLPGGGYAQYCTIPADMGMRIPENLSFTEAAAVPETFLTAFQALHWLGELKEKETVLIHAAGSGVGTSAIQLARHLYRARILTTAGKERKLDTAKELGADYAFHYEKQNFAEEITAALGEEPVDLIIDFIGEPYWRKNMEVLATDGRLVYLSFLGGHRIDNISLVPILRKRLTIIGSTLRSRDKEYKIELTRDFAREALPFFREGVLKPVIDSTYDWSETEKAHQRMQNNENTGKIVLTGM